MKLIAELCQNHNGKIKILEKQVKEAAKNGATHVKIQHIYANRLSFRSQFENGLKLNNKILTIKRGYKKEYNRLKKLELSDNEIKKFINLCNHFDVTPLTTCFTRQDIQKIFSLGFKEIKVASYDCASYEMIRELKNKFNHVYISTGATYNKEIIKTSKIFNKNNFSLLHCVTEYPTKLKSLNLNRIKFLNKYSKNIGYSDHTSVMEYGLLPTFYAIYLGAKIIERHFTVLDKTKTRDGIVSINSEELYEIYKFSRKNKIKQKKILDRYKSKLKIMSGKNNAKFSEIERLNREYYRGRFCSKINDHRGIMEIYNWEETPLS